MDKTRNVTPDVPTAQPVGTEQLRQLTQILQKYKAGKALTERRIIASENWWKLRNNAEESGLSKTMGISGFKSASGWLHNVLTSKHADAMEAYPEPIVRPREQADRQQAKMLSEILPCVLEANGFEGTYSDTMWQKNKTGTGVYKIVWDPKKLNGLGDIAISRVNLLNIYWEPGVEDIQRSRYFFSTELCDTDVLEEQYPQLRDQLKSNTFISTRFLYDDAVSTDGKTTVIECYYHKTVNGTNTLQYVKYANDSLIYATENDPELSKRGLYDHGMYPYVFDALYPIEGSPCGYGYVDLCRNPQTTIDLLNTAIVKNAMSGATPRYFRRQDGGINADQFLDLTNSLVDVNGNLGDDSIRQITFQPLDGIYISYLDRVIQELRETSGNTETSTGSGTPSGVTAASAIAALQEASGKGSRDSTLASYRAFSSVVTMCIELIRQFYDLPRRFRIVGENGAEQFVAFDNSGMQPQPQGTAFGVDLGYRLPVFDIKVSAQKKSVYSKVSQNELALQFFQLGFFNPQMTDQALMCLDVMDFDGRDGIMQKVAENGTMYQKMIQYMQLSLRLAQIAAPDMVEGLSNDILSTMGIQGAVAPAGRGSDVAAMPEERTGKTGEKPIVERARAQSRDASQPDSGDVVRR